MLRFIEKFTGLLTGPLPAGWPGVRIWISVFHGLGCMLLAAFASPGIAAIEWMMAFHPADYPGLKGIYRFLAELQTGIPPIQAVLELIAYDLTGSLAPVASWLYRAGLAGVHLLSLHWVCRGKFRFVLCSGASLVFLWASILIHRQMPVSYDVFFPLLVLSYLTLAPAREDGRCGGLQWSTPRLLSAGLCLAVLELTRPFVMILLPLLLADPLLAFRAARDWRKAAVFFLPLVILSGGWHVKMLVCHGQWVWTNQSGFNLLRAWESFGVDAPPFVDEEGNPANPNLPRLMNTGHHTQMNREVQQAVFRAILSRPGEALGHAFNRLKIFLRPRTSIYHLTPVEGFGIQVYRVCVWFSVAWMAIQVLRLVFSLRGWESVRLLGLRENQLALFSLLSLLILALGEAGEEARLMVSLLPLLGSFPVFQPIQERIPPCGKQAPPADGGHVD